jgi:hypothetical protein
VSFTGPSPSIVARTGYLTLVQRVCPATSSSVKLPSRRPRVNAKPELVAAERFEAKRGEDASRAGVPRVRDHERVALVQRAEPGASLLPPRCPEISRISFPLRPQPHGSRSVGADREATRCQVADVVFF